ncbi:MAG: hypothetical protein H7287_00770 [Thermoleophilia bacterium]|nr:hypothetical protein [Thermoleophilia bacterium]
MSSPAPHHDWHDAVNKTLTDEERAAHRRTRRWGFGLIIFLVAWIPVVFIGFLNRG